MPTLQQILAKPRYGQPPWVFSDNPFGYSAAPPKFWPRFPYPPAWTHTPGKTPPDFRNYVTPPIPPRQPDRLNGAFAYRTPPEPGWGRSGWSYGQGPIGHPTQDIYGLHNWQWGPWHTDPHRGNPYGGMNVGRA